MIILAHGIVMALVAAGLPAAHAQSGSWPEKPLRIVVATAAGSGDDFTARLMAPKLGTLLGQPIVVDNRPGAAGFVGQSFVLKAPPDGHTVLYAGGSMAGARYVNAHIRYDVMRDFTPVSLVMTTPFVLFVHPSVPARNLKEYIALARSHPGKMTYAISGAGQMPYWNALLFNSMARIEAVAVAYKTGSAGALPDVMAGRVDYVFTAAPVAMAHRAKLRALAVTTAQRSAVFPDVPTVAEAALPGFDMPGWASIMGPAGLPRDVVESLNAALGRVLAAPEVLDRLRAAGAEATPSSPEALAQRYADWVERFGRIARSAGVVPQ